ncbi:MAG: hypothetical protein QGG40_03830 [Myxococcota bacterium]|jgi:hypothetical protein|nr:hypothetical protein [Myxococcota bacterium]
MQHIRHWSSILVFLLTLCGCVPSQPPVAATAPANILVAVVLSPVDRPEVIEGSPAFESTLHADLQARGLEIITPPPLQEPFSTRRETMDRLLYLVALAPTELVLLVEAEARYFSQIEGRYRWTVQGTVILEEQGPSARHAEFSFSVPVFLQFHHEREAAALQAAAPVLERRIRSLLDDYLEGRPTP